MTRREAAQRIRRAARARAHHLGAVPSAGDVKTAAGVLSVVRALPWSKIAIAAGVILVAKIAFGGSSEDREERDNPGELEDAERFYKRFHWGRPAKKRKRVKLAPLPRTLVELGTLEAITYAAKKGTEGLVNYVHSFGEEGGRKPSLAADPKSRRLHIVGGDYDVQGRGIVD